MGWKPGVVSLREITDANRADVERLSVATEQARYVASNTESLLEAAATPNACPWYRAVYSDEVPVGFVMISDGIPDTHPESLARPAHPARSRHVAASGDVLAVALSRALDAQGTHQGGHSARVRGRWR